MSFTVFIVFSKSVFESKIHLAFWSNGRKIYRTCKLVEANQPSWLITKHSGEAEHETTEKQIEFPVRIRELNLEA